MSRKVKGDLILITLALIGVFVVCVVSAIVSVLSNVASFIVASKWPIASIAVALISVPLLYLAYQHLYFKGKRFADLKKSISNFVDNCNELNYHVSELKGSFVDIKSFDYGFGSMKDESKFNFKRTQWSNEIKNNYTHNCSAAICKNANNQPLKYLCKYFDIEISEDSLANIESVLNDFAAAEQGKYLLQRERDSILSDIKSSIPWLINNFRKNKLIKELGFEYVDLSDLYFPVYTFQYVSPGGNSSLKSEIKLDIENLDNLIVYLKGLISFKKSIEGQRALMTSSLREKIKIRDNFTCQKCGLSTYDEENLLLEIDHIMPLSKGGITSEKNLQTLCWKCNRWKGSKILHE